jgi:lambda family phage minor tail protein L
MKNLTTTGKQEKNALANAGAWLALVDVDMSSLGSVHLRYTSDNTPTAWDGLVYTPIAMEIGEVQETNKGAIPSVTLRLSNVARAFYTYTENLDGILGAEVTLLVVHSAHLDAIRAEVEEVFIVNEATQDAQWLTLTLGAIDPLTRRFPRDRYIATMCRHVYKGALCRYAGPEPSGETTCNHTLAACEARTNSHMYGGSPGVAEGVYS